MAEAAITSQVITAVVSMGLSALGTVAVLTVSMRFHKEKLDRHSTSLKNAFDEIASLRKDTAIKHEEQQKEIHRLEVEFHRHRSEGRS